MERYLGIDVHRDSSTICVLGPTGKRIRQDVVETNGRSLVSYVTRLAGRRHVCFEESPWSEWLYEILSPHTAELVVFQDEWRPGSKSDSIDAHGLAEKLRIGQAGPGVFKAPETYRKLREWARVYQALTRDLTRVKNRLKAQFLRRGLRTTGTSVYSPEHRADWLQQLPEVMRPTVELLCFELDGLTELKAQAEVHLLEESRRYRISKILQTAPGLGPVRAALLIAIVVTPHRFRTKRQFWSYCGFGVVTRSSADWLPTQGGWIKAQTVRTRGLNRNHNPRLKAIFKGAALAAIHRSKDGRSLQDVYQRLIDSGTRPPLARITIARKIAAAVLAMWKKEEVYKPVS